MRITVFGAGAMGSLYAARLAGSGHRVAVVARGERLRAIASEGLRLRRRGRAEVTTVRVAAAPELAEAGEADLVLVLVRCQHLPAVLPLLAAQPVDVVMMVNVASGYDAWRAALGRRLVVGFPGATARFAEDGVLEHEIAPRLFQPTVLGEPDGRSSARVRALAAALRGAGFPCQIRGDMEAWQRTHAAWMAPFMLAAAAARGADDFATRASLERWVRAAREAVSMLEARGLRPTPPIVRAILAAPPAALAALLALGLGASSDLRRHLVATGAASAGEGRALADALLAEARAHGETLPTLEALRAAVPG